MAFVNGQWVNEYDRNKWAFGPGGGQGLFNPSNQKVYLNNGSPTFQNPNQGGSGTLPNYNVSPSPTQGQGPYGLVPGQIGIPPSAWDQTRAAVPALGNTTQATNNILSELQGDINPQALKNMQDAAANYGISSGMPGSNAIPGTLAFNKNLRNIGLDTQAIQRQGLQDYTSLLGSVSGLQTPQGLAAEIAAHNAQLRAAPDPQKAAERQLGDYWNSLAAARGLGNRGGGGGGGSIGFSPAGGTGDYAPNLGFGGAGGVGNSQGFGFGSSFGGQGGAAATGQPSSIYNDPSQGYNDPFGYSSYYDQGYDDPFGMSSYYDQTAQPDYAADPMTSLDYFYGQNQNPEWPYYE